MCTKNAAPFLRSLIETGAFILFYFLTLISESISNIVYYVKDNCNENVPFLRHGKCYKIVSRHETLCQEVLPPITLIVSWKELHPIYYLISCNWGMTYSFPLSVMCKMLQNGSWQSFCTWFRLILNPFGDWTFVAF